MSGVLEGTKILDFSRVGSGSCCTMLLADMGADVIKIETPPQAPVRGAGYRVLGKAEARDGGSKGNG